MKPFNNGKVTHQKDGNLSRKGTETRLENAHGCSGRNDLSSKLTETPLVSVGVHKLLTCEGKCLASEMAMKKADEELDSMYTSV